MLDWSEVVGKNVRRYRTESGLTQEQLALDAKLDLTYVGGIERGVRNPSILVLAKIAGVLGVEPADLIRR
ncbi:helix-turn-helix transcriptional regulator [Brevundimonas sp.]|uniref:helix-turn-helix domain-containing protein n=1 Tax=Brevundimonas sp. TaxID=1871086 RepID=UPI002624D2D7|nr:helix-turn-helix transcriptional regulator [Brevundimonas sp.]